MSTMSATDSHHVNRVTDPVREATNEAVHATVQARRDGLTELECRRTYDAVYTSTLRALTGQATA